MHWGTGALTDLSASPKRNSARAGLKRRRILFKCPGACGAHFVFSAGCYAASRKNHMAVCCPHLLVGGGAMPLDGGGDERLVLVSFAA